jgi:DNA-damage-inducible protein J
MVHPREAQQIKNQATETLASMGLSVSEAVLLMRVVADKQMPFRLKVPNIETSSAMDEADEIVRTRRTRFDNASELFDDLEKTAASKHSPLPRAADYTKSFLKDCERLSRSGRFDMNRLKEAMMLLIAKSVSAGAGVARSPIEWRLERASGVPHRW